MNMKKVIASVIAGAVAVSAMATSAFAEETTKTFDLYGFKYSAKFTGSAMVTDGDANEVFTFDLDEITSTFDSLKVTSLTIDGSKYTDEETIDLYVTTCDKATKTIVVTPVILDAGKKVSISYEIETAKVDSKSDAQDEVDDNKDRAITVATKITDSDATHASTAIASKVKAELVSTKQCTELKMDGAVNDLDLVNTKAYRQYFNSFFTDATNGKVILKLKLTPKDAADDDDSLNTPSVGDISLTSGGTAATTKDFGLALNWDTTSALTQACDIADSSITFDWDDLTSKFYAQNVVEQISYKANKSLADKYKKIEVETITFVKGDAAATTEASAETDATTATAAADGDTNPGTGAAPVALALIPAALAAVVVAKKRK